MSASESRSVVVLALAEEFLERYRQGERPSLKEYIDRHPELAAEIKEVFPAVAMMENVALADESLAGGGTPPTGQAPPESLQQLGDYRLLREVGRGGMGIVYEAEQVSLGRHVALKVLPRKTLVDATQKRRFEREARAAAKLHHTNIVPVFGVGEQDGLPYYVMQFIQGLGLDEVLLELKRLKTISTPTVAATVAELAVARKEVSAVEVARSLLTGVFTEENERVESARPEVDSPLSWDSSSGKLTDSFALAPSVKLPGSDGNARGKAKKPTYWQSVGQLGMQVADALEYAHKQGILHRDIKPSNLLMDTGGTIWVTDFGLARAETEEHLTQTGDIVGTLRYMPPEAFEGHGDRRGDLYSLGVTLYELLALRPAFEEKVRHKLIKQVMTEEPARLDILNRSIPRDLVTIVHKAIDREPARRYPSAGELAADLQRFLDDEPIQARRISRTERLVRWCRRHPGVATLTATLAVILLTVTVVSVVAAARFDRLAKDQAETAENERQARRAADEAKEQEVALRRQAEEARQQAEAAKKQAESDFAKARKAVERYFTTVSESQLLKVPGMQPLRRELLLAALAFYQEFLKEHSDDPTLRGDLAAAFLLVGKIRNELGEIDEARKAYEQARGMYETLTKAAPESVAWRHGLAQCNFALGRYDVAIPLWQKLVQPGQPRFQKELAEAYNSQAIQYANTGKPAEALAMHQKSLAIREMLVRLNPEDSDAQRDLGGTLNNIGNLLSGKGRLAEALAMHRRAAEHGETAFAQAPQVLLNGYYLAVQQVNIARIERQLGHVNEALAAYRRSVEVQRKMARDNPAVPNLHSSLFVVYRSLADYQRELKQEEQYKRTLRLAREVIDRLPSEGADALFNVACTRAGCSIFIAQGKAQATAEEQAEQKHEADLAMDALRKAIAAGFRDVERLRKTEELNALRGREDFKALEADLAARVAAAPSDKLKANQQALALRQKLAQADPHNKHLRADLAASQHAIALVQLDLNKPDEARKHLDQALALREALAKEEPKNAQYQADLTASRFVLGDSYWQSGRLAEGAKEWQRMLDALETAARPGNDRSSLAGQLLVMRRTIAQHYARAGLWSEAAAHYGRLIREEGVPMHDLFRAACLALRAGDAAAYRRIRERMAKRPSDPREPFAPGWLSWADVLADDPGADPSAAIQRTRAMTDKNPLPAWQYHVLALAHYRAGQFAEAVAQASQSNTLHATWPSHITNGPVLAMAHHRLGHAAQARKWLEKSIGEWRRLSPLTHSLDGTTVLPSASGHWQEAWQDWPTFEILLREASVLIAGAPPLEDAFDHAHRSLLYDRLGESEKAESAWQAAIQIAPRGPELWLARGRAFAQRGRHDKADADFAKAAARTPQELNKFIEAGWWVVGPYPEDLKLPCPPEKDPDPSLPVAAADSAGKLHWRPAPTAWNGHVDLRAIFNADHVSAYALTYVYSPDERPATLLVGGDDRVRVWLNGRLVHETDRRIEDILALDRVPVTLKAGRNVLLCRIFQDISPHYLYLRIAGNPLDRARLLAELGLWDEAADLFASDIDRHPDAIPPHYRLCAHALLLRGDTAGCRRYLARMFERYDRPDMEYGHDLAYAGGILDDAIRVERLVELAEHLMARPQSAWDFYAAGIISYRAGKFEQAIERFEEGLHLNDPNWQHNGGHTSELGLALAHHRLGHARQARQWLDKAEQWYEKTVQDELASPAGRATLFWWPDWPSFIVLRREAHKRILGDDLKDDPRLKKLADRMRDWLRKLDPATADYDVAIFLTPNEPQLHRARAQRLVELKRDKEAEADLDLAVQRQPNDPEMWRERARLHFRLGQTDRAAADFRKALQLLGDKVITPELAASEANKLFARLAEDAALKKLTYFIEINPEDMDLRRKRGEWYIRRASWKEAAADFKIALERKPSANDMQWLHAAPVLVAADDREGYGQLCRRMRNQFRDPQNPLVAERIAKISLLLPRPDEEAQWAGRLADRAAEQGKDNPWAAYIIFCKGLADYRRGDFGSAAKGLNALLPQIESEEKIKSRSWLVGPRGDLSVCCRAVLAMALYRRGEAKAAQAHLAEGAKLIEQHVPDLAWFPTSSSQYNHDWLIAWILHREAQTLIKGKKTEPKE